MSKPLISIVIPTFNSEKTLGKCLKSIRDQTYKNIEVIVVDKFSQDRTVEIANRFKIKVLTVIAKERSEQLNYGIKQSRGKYIYRVDSDFVLDSTVVEEAVEKCIREGCDAIVIHNTSDPSISFWSKVRKLERDCYKDDNLNVAARFIRKDVLESVNGFDEKLVAAEDYDLHNRLLKSNCKIEKINSKEIHIGEPTSLWEIAKKHYYYGKTIEEFIKKNSERGKKQLSPIRSALIRNWKSFLTHPILMAGFIIYQFTRYSSAGLGFLMNKVRK
jgi:glycosyltransferase involved in cell wall biosynthesis